MSSSEDKTGIKLIIIIIIIITQLDGQCRAEKVNPTGVETPCIWVILPGEAFARWTNSFIIFYYKLYPFTLDMLSCPPATTMDASPSLTDW